MLVERTFSAVLIVAAAAALVSACGESNAASQAGLSSEPPCPTSFADVSTATCSVEGQACSYLVSCPTFPANAVCTCTGGTFACTGFGDAGTACVDLTTTGKCPLSERSASGLFCSDLGLICPYPSACTGIPAYDTCQCVGGRTTDEQSHYECTSPCELDAAPMTSLPDASTTDAMGPADATAPNDSPSDAPSTGDGANDP